MFEVTTRKDNCPNFGQFGCSYPPERCCSFQKLSKTQYCLHLKLLFPFHFFATASGFVCDNETIDVCKKYSASWKVARIDWDQLHLSDCKGKTPKAGDQLLLFVSLGLSYNYGKYEIVTVKSVNSTTDKQG